MVDFNIFGKSFHPSSSGQPWCLLASWVGGIVRYVPPTSCIWENSIKSVAVFTVWVSLPICYPASSWRSDDLLCECVEAGCDDTLDCKELVSWKAKVGTDGNVSVWTSNLNAVLVLPAASCWKQARAKEMAELRNGFSVRPSHMGLERCSRTDDYPSCSTYSAESNPHTWHVLNPILWQKRGYWTVILWSRRVEQNWGITAGCGPQHPGLHTVIPIWEKAHRDFWGTSNTCAGGNEILGIDHFL